MREVLMRVDAGMSREQDKHVSVRTAHTVRSMEHSTKHDCTRAQELF